MLMESLRALRDAGFEVETVRERGLPEGRLPDALVEVTVGEITERFVVEAKQRAPYPNELGQLVAQLLALSGNQGQPMLLAPYISEPLGARLIDAGVSWADACGNFDLRTPRLVLRQRVSNSPPSPSRSKIPQGSGSLAIIRHLIGFADGETEAHGATALAHRASVSQPRASQVLHQLLRLDLVVRSEAGRWIPRREELLDRFLAEYRGPGGSERFLYSLDPPTEVAARAAASAAPSQMAISADVAPDLIAAWRRPTNLVIYSDAELGPEHLGLVEARGRADSNVVVRIPQDRSVFPASPLLAEYKGVEIPLADPIQQIWDLQQLGGADRLEAAGEMRKWLLSFR